MRIGFGKEFNIPGFCKLCEAFYDFRGILLELFKCCSRNTERHFKGRPIFFDEVHYNLVGRQIAMICYSFYDMFICVIIIVIMIRTNIKEPVCSKPEWLMNLKIKT